MRSDSRLHPTYDVLECYCLARLPEPEYERVEEHLLLCERCQNEMAAAEETIRLIQEACREWNTRPRTVRSNWLIRLTSIPRPVFAGALAACALMVLVPVAMQQPDPGVPVNVELHTSRGSGPGGTAPAVASSVLRLHIDASQLPAASYQVEIVDRQGERVWSGTPVRDGTGLYVLTGRPIQAGTYWVRLYDGKNELLREFGLQLR